MDKLFQWEGSPKSAFCVYEGYTATIEFIPIDNVYLLQVVLPTEPAATLVIRELTSFNQAIVDAEQMILKHLRDSQFDGLANRFYDLIAGIKTALIGGRQ